MSVEEKGLNELKFPVIYLKDGLAARSFFEGVGAEESTGADDPVKKAEEYRSMVDTQGIVIFDFSDEDRKEESLAKIRGICETAMIPVYAGGNINCLQDVGALLDAGCDLVILNMVKDSNQEMLAEVSETFGR
jgi:phosphoribosyl-ATP pyrophosphohydrolase/phosphoribosyl-AMP cyclohydrolase